MKHRLVRLGQVVDINPSSKATGSVDDLVGFLAMADISEEGRVASVQQRPLADVQKGYTIFQAGDVLLAKITPCFENGKAALVEALPTQVGFGSTEFHVLRPTKEIDPKFLFHLVWNPRFRRLGASRMTGSAGQKRVPVAFLADYEFPLPSLHEQRRIAAILDKVDDLRRKRQDASRLADAFLRAMFFDLFGDPVTNSRGWPTQRLDELGTLDRGVSRHRPRNDPRLLGGDYPLIQTGDVANCDGYVRAFTSTYSEMGLKQSKLWPAGTLCITIAANIAKTGVLLFPACFPDSVVGFSAADRPTVEYVRFWLSFLQQTLEANAPASAQKNINLAILRELQIPVPPRDRVERFSSAVDKVEAIRKAQRLAVDEGQKLHRALGHTLFAS